MFSITKKMMVKLRRSSRAEGSKKCIPIQDLELPFTSKQRKRKVETVVNLETAITDDDEIPTEVPLTVPKKKIVKQEQLSEESTANSSKAIIRKNSKEDNSKVEVVDVDVIQEMLNNGSLNVEKSSDGVFTVSQTSKSQLSTRLENGTTWTTYPTKEHYDCNMNGSTNSSHKHLLHYHNSSECGANFVLGASRDDGTHICGYKSCVSVEQQREWVNKGKFPAQSSCMMKYASSTATKKKRKFCSNKNASFICFTCSTADQPFWICDPRKEIDDDKKGALATDYCWFMHTDSNLGITFKRT